MYGRSYILSLSRQYYHRELGDTLRSRIVGVLIHWIHLRNECSCTRILRSPYESISIGPAISTYHIKYRYHTTNNMQYTAKLY